jgi:hypothetical protein
VGCPQRPVASRNCDIKTCFGNFFLQEHAPDETPFILIYKLSKSSSALLCKYETSEFVPLILVFYNTGFYTSSILPFQAFLSYSHKIYGVSNEAK